MFQVDVELKFVERIAPSASFTTQQQSGKYKYSKYVYINQVYVSKFCIRPVGDFRTHHSTNTRHLSFRESDIVGYSNQSLFKSLTSIPGNTVYEYDGYII